MHRARTAALAVLTVTALASPQLAFAAPAHPDAAAAAKPGIVGSKILLDNNKQFDGYDVATDGKGNAYIGWISDTSTNSSASRAIHLCTLHPTSTSCVGGIQVIDGLGDSSASGLRVLASSSGKVTLVWFHDTTPGSVNGARGGRIAEATSQAGGTLTAATDVADAPSFGQLLDAEVGPGGHLWTVEANGSGGSLEVHEGVANPATHTNPGYSVGTAKLAFSGSTPVLAITQAGRITTPIEVAHGSALSGFHGVANTWAASQFGLIHTKAGIRLMSSAGEPDFYSPVVAKFTGSGFATGKLAGDPNNCAPNSYDLATDASGRLANATDECGKVTVYNLPDTAHAAIVRWSDGGTEAGGTPQIATTPRGRAYVAWSIEGSTGNKLYVARINLPGLTKSVSKSVTHGRITVTGPASCLPSTTVAISLRVTAGSHWKVSKKSLTLNGRTVHTSINGASLSASTSYSLVGHATFARGSSHESTTVTLKFRTCPKP